MGMEPVVPRMMFRKKVTGRKLSHSHEEASVLSPLFFKKKRSRKNEGQDEARYEDT